MKSNSAGLLNPTGFVYRLHATTLDCIHCRVLTKWKAVVFTNGDSRI